MKHNSISVWINDWLLSLNIEKCKVVYSRNHATIDYPYRIDYNELEKINEIKSPLLLFKYLLGVASYFMKIFSSNYGNTFIYVGKK